MPDVEARTRAQKHTNVNEAVETAVLDAAIDELREQAEYVKGHGLNPGDLIEKLTDIEGTMTYKGTERDADQDYVRIYSTKDGMPSDILVNMLSKTLRKKWKPSSDVPKELWGKPVFVLRAPMEYRSAVTPLKCTLHEDNPRRTEFDSMGLAGKVCPKSNLASQFDLDMHMQHRHKNEHATIERVDALAREREGREAVERTARLAEAQVDALTKLLQSLAPKEN